MRLKEYFSKLFFILSPDEKERFKRYLPTKVYHTEKNISILVAASQLCMILLFLFNQNLSFQNPRTLTYFCLYVFLLTVTGVAYCLYKYTVKNKKYVMFTWLRRCYAFLLCCWVLGITFLEQMKGNGLAVYCYLLPTTAALLLLSPLESTIIFGSTWGGLFYMLIANSAQKQHIFGDMVNGAFVTVLSLFISFRYYQSMAKEFQDRETIANQYAEIKKNNTLLENLAHVDQLTGLYNRHYLQETIYPKFETYKAQKFYGMCLMMDIDYFKQYNDTYGHLQGDDCLKNIANIICTFCEEEAASAIRYGGEEFLIIKLSNEPFDAPLLAEKLLQAIKMAKLPHHDVPLGFVTISAGLWVDNLSQVKDIEYAIQQADNALYDAKRQGRNRIVSSQLTKE